MLNLAEPVLCVHDALLLCELTCCDDTGSGSQNKLATAYLHPKLSQCIGASQALLRKVIGDTICSSRSQTRHTVLHHGEDTATSQRDWSSRTPQFIGNYRKICYDHLHSTFHYLYVSYRASCPHRSPGHWAQPVQWIGLTSVILI